MVSGEKAAEHLGVTATVDVWWADLNAGAALADIVMAAEERRKERDFRTEAARLQYRVSKTLVRSVLSRYMAVAPQHLGFEVSPEGKPYLTTTSDLVFNVSHAGSLIVCAVSRGMQLGIDIECQGAGVDIRALAAHYCSAAEREFLAGMADREPFYKLWTLKEAYAKACGQGLQLPLADIEFDLSDTTPRLIVAPDTKGAGGAWHFICHTGARYVLSLAVKLSGKPPRLRFLPAGGLINGTGDICRVRSVPDFLART